MSRLTYIIALSLVLPAMSGQAWGQTLPGNADAVATDAPATTPPTITTTKPAPYPGATLAGMDAERAKVWNSPQMLRARAWLQDYCARSAKVTPEEANQYMAELEALTPTQMKLWLLKFQEHEEMIQQQQTAFNMQRQAGVQRAVGVNQATQQAYSDINAGETAKAEGAQQSINEQTQFSQQMSEQLSADRDYRATMNSLPWGAAWANQSPWGPYAGYPMGGPGPYGPVGGGAAPAHYHVHYHIAPPAAGGGDASPR